MSMVPEHFKLREQPFGVTPDPNYLYASASHREALASLLYGLQSGLGFVSLIAKPGMGKTTLLFEVLSRLRQTRTTVFLFQTISTPVDLIRAILIDLGGKEVKEGLVDLQTQLNKVLLTQCAARKPVVVVIDEAQNLSDSVLETIRMLSNFETASQKLMQIILVGQPQLAEKLMSAELLQLRQRISIFAHLTPLSRHETIKYIQHRLTLAGLEKGTSIFTPSALASIARHSEGIPRNINNLCFNSMSLAFALKRPQIDSDIVSEVISDLNVRGHLLLTENFQFDSDESLPLEMSTEEELGNFEATAGESTFNTQIESPAHAAAAAYKVESREPILDELPIIPAPFNEAAHITELASLNVEPAPSVTMQGAQAQRISALEADDFPSKALAPPSSPIEDELQSPVRARWSEQESPALTSHLSEHSVDAVRDLRPHSPSEERVVHDAELQRKPAFAAFESRSSWSTNRRSWNHTAIVATLAATALCAWLGVVDYRIIFPGGAIHASSDVPQPVVSENDGQKPDQPDQPDRAEYTPDHAPRHRGSVRVTKVESLATLCNSIYGSCTPELLRQLLAQNPSILYPNHLRPGQTISLPLDSLNAKAER